MRHLLIVGCIDKISAGFVKGVQELKRRFLVHASHVLLPFISNAHCPELERRDVDGRMRRQDAVTSKTGLGFGHRGHKRRHDCANRSLRSVARHTFYQGLDVT